MVNEYARRYRHPVEKRHRVSVSYDIGKMVTDGHRRGTVTDQVGDMVRVDWRGGRDEGWYDMRTLRVVEG